MSTYDDILTELSGAIGAPLAADDHNTCRIQFPDGLFANVEPDAHDEMLVIGIALGELPGGKGGEKLLRAALVDNGLLQPPYGTFAYSRKANQLILMSQQRMAGLTGAELALHLNALVEKARIWQDAMQRGITPAVEQVPEEE